MAGRIAWVDEDERIWSPERKMLLALGIDVESFVDASAAYSILRNQANASHGLLILDVMLQQGSDQSIFSDRATNMGSETGLVLARKLCEARSDLPRILFFSRSTDPVIVASIERATQELNALYLKKSPRTSGPHFIDFLSKNKLI